MADTAQVQIDLLCPSYGRPERLATMYRSAKDKASFPEDVHVWAAFEYDDKSIYEVGLHYDHRLTGSWHSAAPAWNALVGVSRSYIVHMSADDLIFKTKGWDDIVRASFIDHPFRVLHYRDDLRDERMALNPFVTRDWIKAVGYIHPELRHFYSDTWIEEIAREAGTLHYDSALHIQQAHWKNSLAPWDETYAKTRGNSLHSQDKAVWEKNINARKDLAAIIKAAQLV